MVVVAESRQPVVVDHLDQHTALLLRERLGQADIVQRKGSEASRESELFQPCTDILDNFSFFLFVFASLLAFLVLAFFTTLLLLLLLTLLLFFGTSDAGLHPHPRVCQGDHLGLLVSYPLPPVSLNFGDAGLELCPLQRQAHRVETAKEGDALVDVLSCPGTSLFPLLCHPMAQGTHDDVAGVLAVVLHALSGVQPVAGLEGVCEPSRCRRLHPCLLYLLDPVP
mmetsp:Transcript_4036/g.7767  ORF Transcript_4036/g.7767 Transcript_4036/m.7767 type:complete len:224 (-) Transcript_4036:1197-1868(-)